MEKNLGIVFLLLLNLPLFSQSPHGSTFNINCSDCHTSDDWTTMRKDMVFDHNSTLFTLEGRHSSIDCRSCHSTLVFSEANTACISCHTDIHQQTVGQDCARCHNSNNWLVDNIAELHLNEGFPLIGAHASVSCFDCHVSESDLRFDRIGNDCINCHREDYLSTTQPDHQANGFSLNCAECHDIHVIDWKTDKVDHNFFPLTKGHDIMDCARCHTSGTYQNTPTDCFECHKVDFQNTSAPDHNLLGFTTNCIDCHTTDPGWNPASMPNHDDYYPLNGAHAAIANDCAACHHGTYSNTPTTCFGCHEDDFNQTTSPDHKALMFSSDCASCHSETSWVPSTFDHDAQHFPIYSGKHEGEWGACTECHTNPANYTEFTCITCHMNPETDDVHTGVQGYNYNSPACLACHPTGNTEDAFDHSLTAFPLTGAHALTDCILCHASGYVGTPTECAACHLTDFNQTTNPNHTSLGLSNDCASCHTTGPGWVPASFPDHDNFYALNGAHAMIATDCAACHNGNYTNTPTDCAGCHLEDYNQTSNPNHSALQFSMDCATCHSESAWDPSTFDHDGQYFPIYSGSHQGEWSLCSECHTNPMNFSEFTCITCHTNPETDDNHNGVPAYSYNSTSCLACHPMGKADDVFDHNLTAFPLTGAHTTTDCIQCHAAGYVGTPTDCAACHTQDFNQTVNPNHNSLGFSNDCASCHSTNPGWSPALFPDHSNFYILDGAHAIIANECAACHNGNYNNTPNTCAGCHTPDFNETVNPNHTSLGFSNDCATCHSTNPGWSPAAFPDHNTYYVLDGAHAMISNDCAACHNGEYNNTPNTCAGCHTMDYNQSTNPNHQVLGFSTDCAMCHTTAPDWMPAAFPNHDDYYMLNGAHAVIANDCAACHNGDYNNTPTTCFGCHAADFNNTKDPDHGMAQFSTDCILCHSENAWEPATFDHDAQYFPIYSGEHVGEWSQCVDCHINPTNYAEFSCTGCHLNPETDINHLGIPGYAYNSPSCFACHPTGSANDAFDHNLTNFPLTGAHISTDCIQCHANGYQGTPTNCDACHLQEYNQTINPNHTSLNFPLDCASCHTTNPGWTPATFPDHNNYYVLDGAHALIANDCAACHNGNYNNTPNTCDGCHMPDYNQSTNPNHTALNLPTDCASCHTTAPGWSPAFFANHDDYYILDGAHLPIANDCAACHNGNYNNTPNTCEGCHMPDYTQSTNPNHNVLNLPTDCASCHTTAPGWSPATFAIHNDFYLLNGAHAIIANDCAACHNGDYNNTPNTCFGCHSEDYNQTNNPDHLAAQFPTDCILCHGESAWIPATLDHSFWPLTGAHEVIANDCNACHNGNYNNTPNSCEGCHMPDYNQSTNPNHSALNLPTDCVSCHTTAPGWSPASFGIHDDFYPLNGAHAIIANDCAACHNGDYNNTPNTCFGCHAEDYNQTNNPDHLAAQFPTDCILCHGESAWIPATLDHSFWPLTGAHELIANDCNACHMGNYNNTPNTCSGCHTPDYNQSTNPSHTSLGLPMDCAMCHTTDPDWIPATFPIHDDFWPLTGAHATIANDCGACHNGNYNNTPATCYGCHAAEYNNTNDPDHAAVGFPTDCELCHTTNGWTPSTWDHDNLYFPIYDGKHEGEWNQCIDCHTTPGNFSLFSCIDCHEHDDPGEVGDDHQGVPGYSYNSQACYSCHPTGED